MRRESSCEIDTIEEFCSKSALRKIVGYVPKKYYKNVALSSRLFNEVICEIQKFEFPLKITQQLLHDCNYEQLMTSKRKFNQVFIEGMHFNDENLELIGNFVESRGSTITTLHIDNDDEIETVIAISKWTKFINKFPNLNFLELNFKNLLITAGNSHHLSPSHLKSLSIHLQSSCIKHFLLSLQINSLKKLKILGECPHLYETIARQTSINELEISECNMHSSIFESLQLDSFTLHVDDEIVNSDDVHEFLSSMVDGHPELKKILLRYHHNEYYCEFRDELLIALCNLSQLEVIEFKFTRNNSLHQRALNDCTAKKVKMDLSNTHNEDLRQIQFKSMEELTMMNIYGLDKFVEEICGNWINLTFLELDFCIANLNLNVFLENLIKLKTFKVYFDNAGKLAKCHFIRNSRQFLSLENLLIQNCQEVIGLDKLLNAAPNLKCLNFDFMCMKLKFSTIKALLKLEKLNQISILFKINSKIAASEDLLSMLRKLFEQIRKISMEFNCQQNHNFNIILKSYFQSHDYVNVIQYGGWVLSLNCN